MPGPHDPNEIIKSLKTDAVEQVMEADDLFDLDKTLSALEAQVKEEAKPQALTTEERIQAQILEYFKGHADAPSQDQINAWKNKHGPEGVQVVAFDSQNIFVYTHLTSSQWEKVQSLNTALQKQGNTDVEKSMREAVLSTAILWPKMTPQWFQTCRAGLPTTLFELVLVTSYFMSPQQALALTVKL